MSPQPGFVLTIVVTFLIRFHFKHDGLEVSQDGSSLIHPKEHQNQVLEADIKPNIESVDRMHNSY